jgi:hypothetical protein
MNDTIQFVMAHWKILLGLWLGFQAVNAMPSPAQTGPTSNWVYKWLFGTLHNIVANSARTVATLAPESKAAQLLGIPSKQTQLDNLAALPETVVPSSTETKQGG